MKQKILGVWTNLFPISLFSNIYDDNGVTLTQNFKKLKDSFVNVKEYGAVGDGTADDTIAIKNAIAYIKTKNGGELYFPVGTYLISSSLLLPSNITLRGENPETTVIKIKPNPTFNGPNFGGSQKIITNELAASSPFNSNIRLLNIGFNGNGSLQGMGTNIAFGGVTNLSIENCHFFGFGNATYYNQGLVIFGGSNLYINNCQFFDCSGDGFAVAEGTVDANITNCLSRNNGDYGLAVTNTCKNINITNNIFKDNAILGLGIDECDTVTISNNICNGNTQYGIRVVRFSPNFSFPHIHYTITDNIMIGNGIACALELCSHTILTGNLMEQTNGGRALSIWNLQNFVVANNIIRSVTHSSDEAIFMTAQTDHSNGNGIINGNYIDNFTYGVRELNQGGTMLKSIVNNNMIVNTNAILQLINSTAENNDYQTIKGTFTWNPAAVETNGKITASFTVTGARLGDAVLIYPPYGMQDCVYSASIQGTDNLVITIHNPSAGSNVFSSGTWGYKIIKY